MNTYKLLTPGPLTTTDTVKEEMLVDRCTWDDDYKAVTQKIRRQLLQLGHVSEDDYTAVLMQGSGTFGVESVLSSVVGDEDKVLICSNGAYGVRMTGSVTGTAFPMSTTPRVMTTSPTPPASPVCWLRTRPLPTWPWSTVRPPAASSTTSSPWARWSGTPGGPSSWTPCPPSAGWISPSPTGASTFWCPAPTSASREYPASPSSCAAGTSCSPARARPALCPWTCWTSGRGWRRTASGASPPPPMWCWPSPRHWTSWRRRGASPPAPPLCREQPPAH